MRVDRVVLEHHRDVAVLRLAVVDDLAADPQIVPPDVLQPGDHPQASSTCRSRRGRRRRRIRHLDREVDAVDDLCGAIALDDLSSSMRAIMHLQQGEERRSSSRLREASRTALCRGVCLPTKAAR
jgi:hypothetical protein